MVRRLSERAQAVVFLVVLAVAIGGLYGWIQASQPPAVQARSVTAVSLEVDGPNWPIRYGPVTTTNNPAFGILLEASQRLHFSVVASNWTLPNGVFVSAINGTTMAGGLSWQYWVGPVYGDRAANLYPLADGDHVTWRFTTDQEGVAA